MHALIRSAGHALFAHRLAAPLWLLLRIYLGSIWLRFGVAKIEGGWLTGNPVRPMLEAVAAGATPVPIEPYRAVAELLLALGADPILSVAIPLCEIAVAIAFLSGTLVVPAAIGAILLNLNLILSGLASWRFDGRIILLQLLLLAAWRVAGCIGGDGLRRASASSRRRVSALQA